MHTDQPRMFDFTHHRADFDTSVERIRRFAAHDAFRSAMVDELELDEDFHRRPLRPEDLSFIDFATPVVAATVTHLPFLASQRLLLCINELAVARLPRDGATESFHRCAEFYSDDNQALAAQIRPFLENFAFDFLDHATAADEGSSDHVARLQEMLGAEAAFWSRTFECLVQSGYVEDGLRFMLIQQWCLAPSKRTALARAAASGYFEALASTDWPRFIRDELADATLRRLAARCGVTKREHSYWQFYLSTSLAECNLLHALASRPDRALRLCGAAFAAEAEWMAFAHLAERASLYLATGKDDISAEHGIAAGKALLGRFERALGAVARRFGRRGLYEVGQGLAAAQALGVCARQNLEEQLRWLAAVEQYRGIARAIDARIQAECPDIDRDTFVEPREMCSTTHVHDDHRLVVIESGQMVFWGNLGMKLCLQPGEMVLVPQGRLHGSSVESDQCTYHQPIIPDEWVRPLVSDLDTPRAAE
jgi:hypothetical protein